MINSLPVCLFKQNWLQNDYIDPARSYLAHHANCDSVSGKHEVSAMPNSRTSSTKRRSKTESLSQNWSSRMPLKSASFGTDVMIEGVQLGLRNNYWDGLDVYLFPPLKHRKEKKSLMHQIQQNLAKFGSTWQKLVEFDKNWQNLSEFNVNW